MSQVMFYCDKHQWSNREQMCPVCNSAWLPPETTGVLKTNAKPGEWIVPLKDEPSELDLLREENARLREALEFYADEKNQYEGVIGTPESPDLWEENPIDPYERSEYRHLANWEYDCGKRAREALKGVE